MDILTLSGVSKSFGNRKIINNLSFSVREHEILGFIGKNGAGKTTTMKMILGLLKTDSGEILVNGETVRFGDARTNREIGYLPDVPEFYGFMTPKEYLMFCGKISAMEKQYCNKRIEELIKLVGLDGVNKRISGFSRGMKQRLGIAQALLGNPKLLICDEPTSALDPLGRKEILDILSNVKEHTAIIFSTHILSDVERICDRISFLHNGKLAICGTIDEVKNLHKGSGLEIEFYSAKDADNFKSCFNDSRKTGKLKTQFEKITEIDKLKIRFERKTEKDILDIMQIIVQNNIIVQRIESLEPTLEELFMEVCLE